MSNSVSPARRHLAACLAPVFALSTAATTGCGGGGAAAVPPPAVGSAPRPPSPAPDAVWLQLGPEERDQRWSLLGTDEKLLCELPCGHWVSPGGAFLQYERPGAMTMTRVDLPANLGPPGGSVVGVARLGHDTERLGTKLILGGVSLGVLGLILFVALDNVRGASSALAISVGLGVGAPFLGAGIYFRVKSRPPDVAVKAATSDAPHARFAVGPGFLEAASSSAGAFHVVVTPLGAAGTF